MIPFTKAKLRTAGEVLWSSLLYEKSCTVMMPSFGRFAEEMCRPLVPSNDALSCASDARSHYAGDDPVDLANATD